MATVYYHTDQGTAGKRPIYGVKNSGTATVPAGIASITVDNPPVGCERTHVVDDGAGTLIPDPDLDARIDAEADAALNDKKLMALARALSNQTIAGIAWSAAGYTPLQIRTRYLAVWRQIN